MNAKIRWKYDEKWDICIVIKYLVKRYLTISRKVNYSEEIKSGRHLLKQVIKVNFTNDKTYDIMYLGPSVIHNEGQNPTVVVFWSKIKTCIYSWRNKCLKTNPKSGTLYKNNWATLFQSVKFMRAKERLRKYHRWEETRRLGKSMQCGW